MQTTYDGRQVVRMDLHRRRSVLVRITEDGRRLGMAQITNSPQELRAEMALRVRHDVVRDSRRVVGYRRRQPLTVGDPAPGQLCASEYGGCHPPPRVVSGDGDS